jgi:hypothetical protein
MLLALQDDWSRIFTGSGYILILTHSSNLLGVEYLEITPSVKQLPLGIL